MSPVVKVFGERNTGTNYLVSLIEKNTGARQLRGTPPRVINALFRRFPKMPKRDAIESAVFSVTERSNLGWKHAAPMPADRMRKAIGDRDVVFVTLTKNPYSWLLSLYDKPYSYYPVWEDKPSFHEFLHSTPPVLARENARQPLTSPIDVWNRKNQAYFALSDVAPAYNMSYETLVADPEGEMERMCAATGLVRQGDFENREESTKPEAKDFDYYQKKYLSESWRDDLTDDDLRVINAQLDPEILAAYGYELIEPGS